MVKCSLNKHSYKISAVNADWKKIKKYWRALFQEKLIPYPQKFELILEKEGILAVNKPAGLITLPAFPLSPKVPRKVSLMEILLAYNSNIKNVHRLDKETSGVILFTKNIETAAILKNLFQKRRIGKTYYALVEGKFPGGNFSISGFIGKKTSNPLLRATNNLKICLNKKSQGTLAINIQKTSIINPKKSLTKGKVVAMGDWNRLAKIKIRERVIVRQWYEIYKKYYPKPNKKIYSLLELKPKTGRTHQLRVHLSALGYPVVGDKLYGDHKAHKLPCHFLHAEKISWLNSKNRLISAISQKIILI
ncbi:MAG: RluA family pseudouridine synthase [Candidatus Moranbacteria bacterium]|nr:RluA family pseudouridine synthase [Candidatus Moranbacteria bacterium]